MNRFKAASIHLGISAIIGTATLIFMLTVWYPGPFFEAVGGGGLVVILMGVDVTIGPLVTLVVFDTAKKRLKLDLTVVALLQLAAFLYGVSIIFEARPVYVAFTVDRFELVRAVDLDPQDLKSAKEERFKALPLWGPQVIGIRRPTGDEKLKAIELAMQGKDLQLRPEYYTSYDSQRDAVKAKLQPIGRLKDLNPAAKADIDRAVRDLGKKEDQVGFVPLRAREKDLTAVIDRASGDILGYWKYRPWEA